VSRKSHGSGIWITGPRLTLGPWWIRNHGAARLLQGSRGHRDSLEREKRSCGFSPIAPLRAGAVEMATRRCSTEAVDGASMGRWFWARRGEIGAGVGAMDNRGALVMTFIGR
jgi:hypothetical protein